MVTRRNMMVLFSVRIYGARDAYIFFFWTCCPQWSRGDTCPRDSRR